MVVEHAGRLGQAQVGEGGEQGRRGREGAGMSGGRQRIDVRAECSWVRGG